jgi:hypothetical protein
MIDRFRDIAETIPMPKGVSKKNSDHFVGVNKMIPIPKDVSKEILSKNYLDTLDYCDII